MIYNHTPINEYDFIWLNIEYNTNFLKNVQRIVDFRVKNEF